MVLRADPGVTLPGWILGSSIIWGITRDEPLLSVSFPVCNGNIAGVPRCYEDRLGYYNRSPLHVLIIHQSRRVGSKEQPVARVLSDQQGMCPLSRAERGGQRNPSLRLLRNRQFWFVPLLSVTELRSQKICLPRAEAAKCTSSAAWLYKQWGYA